MSEENKNIESKDEQENIPEFERSEIPPSGGTTNLPTGQAGYQPLNKWK